MRTHILTSILTCSSSAPLAACAIDAGDGMESFSSGAPTAGVEETGGDTDGDPTAEDSGEGDGDPGDGGDGDPGDGDDGGGEYACEFEAGCHLPHEPDFWAGISSDAPVGCGHGAFALRDAISLDSVNGGSVDASKNIPLAHDLDGDGHVDLVLNGRKMKNTVVFTGDGSGVFSGKHKWLSGGVFAGGWGIDLGDVDGDGRLDIVVGDHVRGAKAFRNEGGLGFSGLDSGLPSGTFSGAGAGDLDGDGMLDIVLGADQFGEGLAVALSTGDGWMATGAAGIPPYVEEYGNGGPTNVGYFAFHDYDDDGDLDVFAFGQRVVGVSAFIYRNAGDGESFSPATELVGGSAQWIGSPVQGGLGDVDCDGLIDVATGGKIHLGDGSAWSSQVFVNPADVSHLADMNGDGHLDLVTHSTTMGLRLYLGDGTGETWTWVDVGLPDAGHLPPEHPDASFTSAYGVEIADVDGNGNLDIIRAYKITEPNIYGSTSYNFVEVWAR